MTKISWRAGTMLAPLPPALISCGTKETPNVMTAAWTVIICSDPVITYVSIRPERHSHKIISETKEFVINLPTYSIVHAVDYCGVRSGRDHDKFKEMKLTPLASSVISAPQIEECPVSIECRVIDVKNFGTHDMFTAEVVAVNVDDKFINESGALDLEKAGIIAFAHGKYYTLGRCLGSFGFSVNKAKMNIAQKMKKVEVEVKPTRKKTIEKPIEKNYAGKPSSRLRERPKRESDDSTGFKKDSRGSFNNKRNAERREDGFGRKRPAKGGFSERRPSEEKGRAPFKRSGGKPFGRKSKVGGFKKK